MTKPKSSMADRPEQPVSPTEMANSPSFSDGEKTEKPEVVKRTQPSLNKKASEVTLEEWETIEHEAFMRAMGDVDRLRAAREVKKKD